MPGSVSQSPSTSTRRARKSIAHFPSGANKENNTISGIDINATVKVTRKTRSKSIGPGGLDVLNETAGNSQKIISSIRSILKPTIPISPIRVIPPRNVKAQGSRSPQRGISDTNGIANQEDRSLEQQKEEARQREKDEIQQRREARRKSLANRRVSFAPEATLHTWNIVELPEDATTSSEGANSTRRASSGSTLQTGNLTIGQSFEDMSANDNVPSTPPGLANNKDMKQHGRSTDISAQFVAPADLEAFSSPGDSIASEMIPSSEDDADVYSSDEDSGEDKDSVIDSNSIAGIDDAEDNEDDASSSPGSSSRVDGAALSMNMDLSTVEGRNLTGINGFAATEEGDATMDLIDDDTMFLPSGSIHTLRARSQENINPFSPAFGARTVPPANNDNSELSMDMTMMMGGIVTAKDGSPKKSKRRTMAASNRRSLGKRRYSTDSAVLSDETMDLVTIYGGIQPGSQQSRQILGIDDGELSMDMTQALGKIDPYTTRFSAHEEDAVDEVSMDMTQVLGGFLPNANQAIPAPLLLTDDTFNNLEAFTNAPPLSPLTEYTEPSEHGTINTDITRAVGQIFMDIADEEIGIDAVETVNTILPVDLKVDNKLMAKQLMEEEADHGQLTRSPFIKKNQEAIVHGLEQGAASAMNGHDEHPNYLSATQATSAKQNTPSKKPNTPSKQQTPKPTRPTTPSKTPPNPNISMRKTSPKRLFKTSTSKSPKTATPSLQSSKSIFKAANTPLVILTPSSRRASGIGIDQIGIGSPIAAAKLDRRASIGESTPTFVPAGGKAIRFEDPRIVELELDEESVDAPRSGSIRSSTSHDQDTADNNKEVSSLKDMIATLSPKKNKFKGRKSLAPSARGILGKRPIELDEDEDATPKKLKGIHSPVKSIHLPGPLDDATLQLGSIPQFNLPGVIKPFTSNVSTAATSLGSNSEGSALRKEAETNGQISLQDFLNLTNIQFMDLTTTKRRHTAATNNGSNDDLQSHGQATLTDCVVAGVCTIPMLDLFQHSCRELKKYIAEGRSVVREIEQDTLEDNPALFREYITAPLDIREIMDNQFKNIKVHARYESKASWYEWRSKLFDGLKTGLVGIHEGLLHDEIVLEKQETLLHDQVDPIVEKHAVLQKTAEQLQSQADELADCDHDALRAAREGLTQREQEIEEKKKLLAELRDELAQGQRDVAEAEERKSETVAEIKEANRKTDENRGWAYGEVKSLRDSVDDLETRTGWAIQGCHDSQMTFVYHDSLFLLAFADFNESPIRLRAKEAVSLTYAPANHSLEPAEPPTIYRFFLQHLKARLSALPYTSLRPELKALLDTISTVWKLAQCITAETAQLRTQFHTTERIVDDSTLLIESMILLRAPEEADIQSKLHAQFSVKIHGEAAQASKEISFQTKTIYGKTFAEKDIVKFVMPRIKNSLDSSEADSWKKALVDVKKALLKGKVGLIR